MILHTEMEYCITKQLQGRKREEEEGREEGRKAGGERGKNHMLVIAAILRKQGETQRNVSHSSSANLAFS